MEDEVVIEVELDEGERGEGEEEVEVREGLKTRSNGYHAMITG